MTTTVTEQPVSDKKRKTRTKNTVRLVEVRRTAQLDSEQQTIYQELPIPAKAKDHTRAAILAAVKEAAEAGDETYDGKEITVISFQPSVTVLTKQVRKVSIQ